MNYSIPLLHPLTEWNYEETVDFTILLTLFIYILLFGGYFAVAGDPRFRFYTYLEWGVLLSMMMGFVAYFRYKDIEVNKTKYLVTSSLVLLIAVLVMNIGMNLGAISKTLYELVGDFIEKRTHLDMNLVSGNFTELLKRNLFFFVTVLLAGVTVYYANRDPASKTNFGYFYFFIITLLLTVGYYLTPNDTRETSEDLSKFLYKMMGLAIMSILVALFYYLYLLYASSPSSDLLNSIFIVLIGLIIMVGLAIMYYFMGDYFKRQTGTIGFIIHLIFYIPCLFSEFIVFIKNQMQITPSVVYILFILEILLILVYVCLPKIINAYIHKNSFVLLNHPVFLNTQKIVSENDMFILKDDEHTNLRDDEIAILKDTGGPTMSVYRNSNYAFSFWVFINSTKTGIQENDPNHPENSNFAHEIEIFNYAGGKPRITYVNDRKNDNYFNVYFTNSDNSAESKRKVMIPIQKWTQFVFNYLNNSADLFINGNLEKTFSFDENNSPLKGGETDVVSVGNNNGINGAICNVVYYTQPLSEKQIITNYNLLVFSNPPIQE